MPHVFEPAASGRAKCRGCAQRIEQAAMRFGERVPNAYAEGETTLWYHPLCAAYKRPEALLEALPEAPPDLTDRDLLERAAQATAAHERLPRIDGAERSPTGQAKCRACREPIAKGSWRIRLAFYEEGRWAPGGFLHLGCGQTYFESENLVAPLLHFSPELNEQDREELTNAMK
jgi:hypothetical protein